MVYSRETALKNAMKDTTNTPGTCQLQTRLWFNAPSVGDFDRDGDADAVDGWKSETKKHPGDRNPPVGVPVAFSGGSKGYGHRAITRALGGNLRSTDMSNGRYKAGTVGNATIAEIERAMGVKYLGWSETIDGLTIPKPASTPKPSTPAVQLVSFVLDVSHHQFDDGFKLKMAWDQGYRYVILKCTQGVNYSDPAFKSALAEAQKLGFKVSVYHFLEQRNGAKQAENLARNIVDKQLPVWIDWEPTRLETKDPSRPKLADMKAFRDRAKALGLRVVGKYLGESYWNEIGKPNIVGPLDLWRPAYPVKTYGYASKLYPGNNNERWNAFGGMKPGLWQFTQNARINGFSKGVDVSAYRGSHEELDLEGWFKDYSKKPTPAPTPPAPKPPAKPKTLDFKVYLNPTNTHSKTAMEDVKAEMGQIKALAGPHAVVMNTELHAKAARDTAMKVLGTGWEKALENEVMIAWRNPNWSLAGTPVGFKLAKDDPSMAGVSPARAISEVPLKHKSFADDPIWFLDTHWVSEANCIHKDVPGRAWREKNYKVQRNDWLTQAELLHNAGFPLVLGGDFNTGVYFTSKELFAMLQARVGADAKAVHLGGLDSIFTVDSKTVKFTEFSTEVKVNTKSDHDMVIASLRAAKV